MGKKIVKTMFQESFEATYLFETTNFDGTFTRWSTKVLVLGQTEKRYLI